MTTMAEVLRSIGHLKKKKRSILFNNKSAYDTVRPPYSTFDI